jgi:hypothetical protein
VGSHDDVITVDGWAGASWSQVLAWTLALPERLDRGKIELQERQRVAQRIERHVAESPAGHAIRTG